MTIAQLTLIDMVFDPETGEWVVPRAFCSRCKGTGSIQVSDLVIMSCWCPEPNIRVKATQSEQMNFDDIPYYNREPRWSERSRMFEHVFHWKRPRP
jgi:hypothetical protein